MLKVYSYPRSGTNFLLFAIYENFYKNSKQIIFKYNKNFENDLKNYVNFNEERKLVNNAMSLFGNHYKYDNSVNTKNSVYILRNPYDCLYSHYLLERSDLSWYVNIEKNISYYDWLVNGNKILEWKQHCDSFINKNIYTIKYEDLVGNYLSELEKLKKNFNLNFCCNNIIKINKKVGWVTNKQYCNQEKLNSAVIDLFKKNLPERIHGYHV